MKIRIALATDSTHASLSPDDRLLAEALSAYYDVEPLVWSEANANSGYDLCVIRSTWDSHLHPAAYLSWVTAQAGRSRLFNSARVVRWNFHKGYLLELAAAGVPVIPTVLYARGDRPDVGRRIGAEGWTGVVVKPAISASAYKTARFNAETEMEPLERYVRELLQERDVLVQPLREEVFTTSERSAVFIGGVFSHAVRRLPFGTITPNRRDGDERVPFGAPEAAFCEKVLTSLPEMPLYARIDYIVDDTGGPMLMEVELIDPSLFFQHRPESAERFVDALKAVAK